jgi:arsenite-transporting ATPase
LLLDAAEAYHREVMRVRGDMPEPVRQLLPRLRDPAFTRVIITTLAEATPVHEAERLQQDLARAGIKPYAWVINQSLLASGTRDPLLSERGRYEIPFIRKVAEELSPRCALIPWLAEPPIGAKGLAGVSRLALTGKASFATPSRDIGVQSRPVKFKHSKESPNV